jgi:hypothetical protein
MKNDNNKISGKDVSTKFQVDHTAKFLPVGQDKENMLGPEEAQDEKARGKVELAFNALRDAIESCKSENCSVREISRLIDMLDNPELKNDLNQYKIALQKKDQEIGANSKLAF